MMTGMAGHNTESPSGTIRLLAVCAELSFFDLSCPIFLYRGRQCQITSRVLKHFDANCPRRAMSVYTFSWRPMAM
jgi:hypothetical protein